LDVVKVKLETGTTDRPYQKMNASPPKGDERARAGKSVGQI